MAAAATPYPQFLLFGDSIIERSAHLTDGFSLAAALQSRYIRRLDVVNRGLSGYNTAQALEILPKIVPSVPSSPIEYLLILFGANDAALAEAPTLQHVPLHAFRRNLRAIITHPLVAVHRPKIILVTPPPVEETQQEIKDASRGSPLTRKAAVTAEYARAVRDVGVEVGGELVVLDLWSVVMENAILRTPNYKPGQPLLGTKETGPNEALINLIPDGLHFSTSGYKIFLRALLEVIEKKWPDTSGENSYVFPTWQTAPKAADDTSLEG